jgi:hypothetical protein
MDDGTTRLLINKPPQPLPHSSCRVQDLSRKHQLAVGLGMKEGEKKVEAKAAALGREINWQDLLPLLS